MINFRVCVPAACSRPAHSLLHGLSRQIW